MGKNQSLTLPFPLILASTSKYRAKLLSQLGWTFETLAPGVDEDKMKALGLSPTELAKQLSIMKAHAVHIKKPLCCVIGSDQVLSLEDKILGKPHTEERAIEQLHFMQGKTHELITAVTVKTPFISETFINSTKLHMRSLTLQQIKEYVEADLPLDCAGSYKLESRGIKLFHHIEMSDYTSIIGLPLIELSNLLIKMGYPQ